MTITRSARWLTACFSGCIALAGCARPATPVQVRPLTELEAGDLWASAVSNEPVGNAAVRKIDGGKGELTVTTTRVYHYTSNKGTTGGLVTTCGFSYTAPAGGSLDSCAPTGCEPLGNTCTVEAVGACNVTQPCRPLAHLAFSGVGPITAGSR